MIKHLLEKKVIRVLKTLPYITMEGLKGEPIYETDITNTMQDVDSILDQDGVRSENLMEYWMENVIRTSGLSESLLREILPKMDGNHSIDDIIGYSGVSKDDVDLVISRVKGVRTFAVGDT